MGTDGDTLQHQNLQRQLLPPGLLLTNVKLPFLKFSLPKSRLQFSNMIGLAIPRPSLLTSTTYFQKYT